MTLRQITFKEAAELLIYRIGKNAEQENFLIECANLYLKDGDGGLHQISEFDLIRDRIVCEDDYFDYFKYIINNEGNNDRLFIKEE